MKSIITKHGKNILITGICILSLLACVKCVFFGLTIDEEYAITMPYRMLGEDSMFYTMWEPHQTSAFLCALLLKPFLLLTGGSTTYMVIYLRIMGILLHLAVCTFLYSGLKHICSPTAAFLLSALCFSILPKWILIPEFSNMLLWATLCMMACLLHMQYDSSLHLRWSILAGFFTCIGVLAYPSFLPAFLIYIIAIYIATNKSRKATIIYITICGSIGIAYVLYFCLTLGVTTFTTGIMQMMTDGEHSTPILPKLISYARSLREIALIFVLLCTIFFFACKIFKIDILSGIFLLITLASAIWQFFAWIGDGMYYNEPLSIFYHLYFCVVLFTLRKWDEALIYILPPTISTLGAMALTNTGVQVVSVFLLPTIIYGIAKLSKSNKNFYYTIVLLLLGLFLFAKGWLLCENGGFKADMLYVKQKALSGPAKNIYCRYLDGYDYNNAQEFLDAYAKPGENILCVSGHTLWYLLGDFNISNYSTISTPTYDERLLEYYERFPEKYPDLILMHNAPAHQNVIAMFNLEDSVAEIDGLFLYRTQKGN